MKKKKNIICDERKANARKKRRALRKRKPKRWGSRNQTGKRLPVWYVLHRKGE